MLGGTIGLVGTSPNVVPTDLLSIFGSRLKQWLRTDSLTIGATPLASGTTPPVVTFSGNLNQTLAAQADIVAGGAVGVGTVRLSTDNGATFGPTVTIPAGPLQFGTTGLFANFPAGTYSSNNLYRATAETFADKTVNGHVFTNAVPAQQALLLPSGLNNIVCADFDGSNDWYLNTTYPMTPFVPTLVIAVLRQDGWSNTRNLVSGNDALNINMIIQQFNTSTHIGGVNANSPAVAGNRSALALGSWGRVMFHFANSSRDFGQAGNGFRGGTPLGGNTGTAGRRIGTNALGTSFANMSLLELAHVDASGGLTANDMSQVSYALGSYYGSGLLL